MLGEEVRLDLVGRAAMRGKLEVAGRYLFDDRPAIIVFDPAGEPRALLLFRACCGSKAAA